MQAQDEGPRMTRNDGAAAPGHKRLGLSSRGDATTRHERAVLHAEVMCLVNALSPFRVLRRDALARAAGATRWHENMFDRAIKAAVAPGQITELPLRFYALPSLGGREDTVANSPSEHRTSPKPARSAP